MAIYCTENERSMYEEKGYWRSLPDLVPSVVFPVRAQNHNLHNKPYQWKNITTFELFSGKKVLVFSLPGAFTPTCDTYQLPHFEELAMAFYEKGFDEIYCVSVNDTFVMNKWAQSQNLEHVVVIPDGSCKFTEGMQMQVDKDNLGFGRRSWRYACVVENGSITDWFIEEGKEDNLDRDPYLYTNPQYIYDQLCS